MSLVKESFSRTEEQDAVTITNLAVLFHLLSKLSLLLPFFRPDWEEPSSFLLLPHTAI